MSCCYRSSNCSGVTVFTIWSSLFFLACRQVVKSQLRHDYTASSSPFPRFRKFDAFPFPLQFRNSARNSGIPRFTIGHILQVSGDLWKVLFAYLIDITIYGGVRGACHLTCPNRRVGTRFTTRVVPLMYDVIMR